MGDWLYVIHTHKLAHCDRHGLVKKKKSKIKCNRKWSTTSPTESNPTNSVRQEQMNWAELVSWMVSQAQSGEPEESDGGWRLSLTLLPVACFHQPTELRLILLTHSIPQNEALIPQTLPLFSWKIQPNWNCFQNELPSDEMRGLPSDEMREFYHFLLHCFDVQISDNAMASKWNISFLKHWLYTFHGWWHRAWCWWLGRWTGTWFWINWGGGKWRCVRERWQLCNVHCWNVSVFIGFFQPRPNFAPLSPNIPWARGSDSLHTTGYEKG